ncbi:MAG: hypothetical protein GEU94_17350 [Micromonosporaceae bacterium]|nr:hypothetical protein [Micromonosporaceae bacterium]
MSLDDLLTTAREHRSTPDRSRIGVGGLVKISIVAAVLGFVAYHLLVVSGHRAPYLLVTAVALAIGVAVRLTVAAHGPPRDDADESPTRGRRAADEKPEWAYQSRHDRPYDGVRRWISRLSHVDIDRSSFRRVTHPAIVALIDERLRLRHGVDRRRDPGRARQLLGELLWRFVTEPPPRSPTPVELTALAEQIERLGTDAGSGRREEW